MVKSVCETVPEFLFWVPPFYQDLGTYHDWPLVKVAIVDFPVSLKGNSKFTSDNSSNSLGAQSEDLGAALQTSLTGVKLRLGHRLRFKVKRLYDRFTAVVTAWLLMGLLVVRYPLSRDYILAVCTGVRKVANVASVVR